MDVKALYTNIPNYKGIAAVKQKHDNYAKKTVAPKLIIFLVLLTLSNFIFNSKCYLQIKSLVTIYTLTQTYSCMSLKRGTSTLSLKTNPAVICALSTIFLWYESNQRTNLNPL